MNQGTPDDSDLCRNAYLVLIEVIILRAYPLRLESGGGLENTIIKRFLESVEGRIVHALELWKPMIASVPGIYQLLSRHSSFTIAKWCEPRPLCLLNRFTVTVADRAITTDQICTILFQSLGIASPSLPLVILQVRWNRGAHPIFLTPDQTKESGLLYHLFCSIGSTSTSTSRFVCSVLQIFARFHHHISFKTFDCAPILRHFLFHQRTTDLLLSVHPYYSPIDSLFCKLTIRVIPEKRFSYIS